MATRLDEVDESPTAPAPWTLADLEDMAVANNPTMMQAQANVASRAGQQTQAGLYPNPRLGYMHGEIGSEGRAGQQGMYVAQEFVRGGKLALQQHAAAHATTAATFRHLAQKYRVLTAVRSAFYDVLVAQETVLLAQQLVETSQQGLQTTEALITGGTASRVDMLQVRVELSNAQIQLQKATNRHAAAWQQLAAVVGDPQLEPRPLIGSFEADDQPLDAQQLLDQILNTSPELSAAEQEVYRAEVALQRALVEPVPNVDLQAGAQYDYSSEVAIANVQIEFPWPIYNRNQGQIATARAELMAATWERQRVELQLRQQFAETLERFANADAAVKRYRDSIVPDAKESLELLSEAYRAEGRIDFLRLLVAQRTNFTTQIEYYNALRDWWTARNELDGLLLTGGLTRPE